ncbi:MAG: phosphate acyltransferase PlsX [Myxococcales bacterium]|nr:phosphate acyltransferase PlsX [Myxococcales bacterium]
MGGDLGPAAMVRAACEITRETDIHCILVGDPDAIRPQLARFAFNEPQISLFPTLDAIGMHEDPKEAVRRKPTASVIKAARLVAGLKADAMVTAGNTGAAVLACHLNFPKLPGVRRTGLAAVYPTAPRPHNPDVFALLLDVGATVHCEADDLVYFAYMGSAYASKISKVPSPTVGLLNIGTEAHKGGPVLAEAHRLLKCAPGLNFIGNVEGMDIPKGTADVIVCEGMLGNVVLKMLEGVGEVVASLGAQAYKKRLLWKLGMIALSGGIKQVREATDYSSYGGAPVFGFERLCIKAHGRSNHVAVKNAIKVAAKAVRDDVIGHTERGILEFQRLRAERGETAEPRAEAAPAAARDELPNV